MIARIEPGTSLTADVGQRLHLHNDQDERHAQEQEAQVKPQGAPAIKTKPLPRPESVRRITYPDSSSSQTNTPTTPTKPTTNTSSSSHLPFHVRNRSPYRPPYTARGHLRSRSSNNSTAPPMSRTSSSPAVPQSHYTASPSSSPGLAPSSPMRLPTLRSISPLQSSLDDTHSASMTSSPFYDGAIESISEDAELDFAPRAPLDLPQPIPFHATMNSARPLSVRRQRPASPLHSLGANSHTPASAASRSSSGASSPALPPTGRFNENYPTLTHYPSNSSFSSVPSTPTSTRSRSPSVSSLETIEDAPDAEWEAIEADRLAKLRAAAEADHNNTEGESRRRGSLDIPGARSGVGFGFGRRGDSSRKRWSVCGGERRADLDLETIWED